LFEKQQKPALFFMTDDPKEFVYKNLIRPNRIRNFGFYWFGDIIDSNCKLNMSKCLKIVKR